MSKPAIRHATTRATREKARREAGGYAGNRRKRPASRAKRRQGGLRKTGGKGGQIQTGGGKGNPEQKKSRAAQCRPAKRFLFSASVAAVAEAKAAAAAADEDQNENDPEAVVKAKPGVTHNVLPPVMD